MGSRSSARTKSVIALAVRSERWYCVGSPWVNLGPRRMTEGRQGETWRNFMRVYGSSEKGKNWDVCKSCWLIFLDSLWWILDNKIDVQTMGLLPTHWRNNERPAHHLGRPQNGQVNKNKKTCGVEAKGLPRHPAPIMRYWSSGHISCG